MSEEILVACNEQVGVAEIDDEAGASQAVQMLRALRNKNILVVYFLAISKFDFAFFFETYFKLIGVACNCISPYFTLSIQRYNYGI